LGDTIWTRTYGGIDYDYGYSICAASDSGYIVVGSTECFGAGNFDVWILKLNSSGDTVWTKTYGGSMRDEGYCVKKTTDGGYIIAGKTYSFGAGDYDAWILKLNSSGDTVWTKTYGFYDEEYATSVTQISNGGYIITGYRHFSSSLCYFVLNLDTLGETVSEHTYGGSLGNYSHSVAQTTDGGYIITGKSNIYGDGYAFRCFLQKFDSDNTEQWLKNI